MDCAGREQLGVRVDGCDLRVCIAETFWLLTALFELIVVLFDILDTLDDDLISFKRVDFFGGRSLGLEFNQSLVMLSLHGRVSVHLGIRGRLCGLCRLLSRLCVSVKTFNN